MPFVDGAGETNPIPPACWTVPAQLHPPPAALVQVSDEYPRLASKPAAPLLGTGDEENTRHDAARVNCAAPDVVVSSENVPSALAVHIPVTERSPVTGADGQPAPTSERSRLPVTFKQDDATVQVPMRSPPHAVTLEQEPPAPPLPARPPVALVPPLPEFPAAPDEPPEPVLHDHEISPAAVVSASAREAS